MRRNLVTTVQIPSGVYLESRTQTLCSCSLSRPISALLILPSIFLLILPSIFLAIIRYARNVLEDIHLAESDCKSSNCHGKHLVRAPTQHCIPVPILSNPATFWHHSRTCRSPMDSKASSCSASVARQRNARHYPRFAAFCTASPFRSSTNKSTTLIARSSSSSRRCLRSSSSMAPHRHSCSRHRRLFHRTGREGGGLWW